MWWAVKNSNLKLSRILLEGGGNPNLTIDKKESCLHMAVQNEDLKMLFLLLDYGGDLNVKNSHDKNPLYYATMKLLKGLGLQEATVSG